jgi:hypothetical protein
MVGKYYRIMGNHQGQTEEIDGTEVEAEAREWQAQYQLDYGPSWVVWVEVQTYLHGQLDECYPLEGQ